MHFIFAKLFERTLKKDRRNAIPSTLGYISIFYFILLFSIFLPVSVAIEKKMYTTKPEHHELFSIISVISLMILTWSIVQLYYKRNDKLHNLAKKHKQKKLTVFFLSLLAFLVLILLFLLGPTITVLLNGGTMFIYEIKGLLN